jgi:hypothetical protein
MTSLKASQRHALSLDAAFGPEPKVKKRTLETTAEDILDAWDLSPAVKAAQNWVIKRRR